MALIIEHRFPLGRFHATRWNQGAFGDAYGEWPPSPWRLLRALAMRWFQYTRESENADEMIRDSLLQSLAGSLPTYSLPSSTWRGPALKQYQPTNIDWSDKSKAAAGYKRPQTTLVEDHYRVVPLDESLFWCWDQLDLTEPQQQLLDRLLERMLYFGRAESFTRLRRVAELPAGAEINCRLDQRDSGEMRPVLVHLPNQPLDIEVLLAATDDKELKGRSIPPGTLWYYAQIPRQPAISPRRIKRMNYPDNLNCIQFAVGGRVYPPLRRWVTLNSRFRGRTMRHWIEADCPEARGRYDLLSPEQKERLSFISGKDGQGQPLRGHRHAYFLLWPDEHGLPTRLIVWRSTPFASDEIEALLKASEYPIAWDDSSSDWRVKLVPLPQNSPVPAELLKASCVWESATPFVPPAERHRFRKNGRERPGESPERILTWLFQKEGKPESQVTLLDDLEESDWVNLHETRNRRFSRDTTRTSWVRPGFRLRVKFDSPVSGPLIVGDSCHFGLGLFLPVPQY